MKKATASIKFAGKTLTLEVGKLAPQATTAISARLGDTMVLVTVVASPKETTLDYFPLSVEYVEKLYAGGRIKGSRWVKREGRPTDDAILAGRLIDRSIRPLFPKEYKHDVQIVITVLSVDGENEPDVLALVAVSAALSLSPIPWAGPIAGVRMGYIKEAGNDNGEFLVNPGGAELDLSELDLVVSQSKEKTVMLEAGALQVPEAIVLEAIKQAHVQNKLLIDFIEEFVSRAGEEKIKVAADENLNEYVAKIEKGYKEEVEYLVQLRLEKEAGSSDQEQLVDKIFQDEQVTNPDSNVDKKTIAKALEKVFFKVIRQAVLVKNKRVDGRDFDQIREITIEIGLLPRTHGSALFQRGLTQALSIATLGSPRLEQLIESAGGEESKRYIHHYSGPPYSFGQTGRFGFLGRREIGHGALAERALLAVIPTQEKFPYTIRVVSEVLSQNGSSSMASTCGSTLALMDAGVPISAPVAGISIGMISSEEKYVLLTDIIGLEDFAGDMDFKVAGTDKGITAIQLDVKTAGLNIEQVEATLARALQARLVILAKIAAALPASRSQVSEYAPKIVQIKIPVGKIGEVIGTGGRIIKNIIATTGATVDVEDDGAVSISGTSAEAVQKAVEWVEGLTRDIVAGEVFEEAEVKRILPFGAFVEFLPGKEGMVHVSQMAAGFVKNPTEVVKIGQKVKVRVAEVDEQGRINLSMRFEEQGAVRPVQPVVATQPFIPAAQPVAEQKTTLPHPLARQFAREKREKDFRARQTRPSFRKKPY